MARFLHHDLSQSVRKFYCRLLALCWVAGLMGGIWAFFLADDSLASLMRSSVYGPVSIVSLLCVTGLPFLLSAFAVFLSSHWLILLIAAVKGFVYAFICIAVTVSFGCAGWLIRLLLCFTDTFSMPLLYWFWLRCFRFDGSTMGSIAVLAAALFFLTGSVDYCLITPYLADLIIL